MPDSSTPPLHVTVDGRLTWQLTEAGRVVQTGEQHNLWLNQGLDRMAVTRLIEIADYLCVGTGTTEPAVTDAALVNELARTTRNPGNIAVGPTYVTPNRFRLTFQREFAEEEANGNLTEWGAAAASAGALVCRELFRDQNGTAIPLTKTAAQKLRLTYYLEFTVGPTALVAAPLSITGLGDFTGTYCLHDNGISAVSFAAVQSTMTGAYDARVGPYPAGQPQAYGSVFNGYYNELIPPVPAPYVPGSYRRHLTVSIPTTHNNVPWYGIVHYVNPAGANNAISGYSYKFMDGQSFTKDDLHRLDLTLYEVTWGRA